MTPCMIIIINFYFGLWQKSPLTKCFLYINNMTINVHDDIDNREPIQGYNVHELKNTYQRPRMNVINSA